MGLGLGLRYRNVKLREFVCGMMCWSEGEGNLLRCIPRLTSYVSHGALPAARTVDRRRRHAEAGGGGGIAVL